MSAAAAGGAPGPAQVGGHARVLMSGQQMLRQILVKFLGVDDTNYDQEPIPSSLQWAGVDTWDKLCELTEEDVQQLMYYGHRVVMQPQDRAVEIKLSLYCKRQLLTLLACYHNACRERKARVNFLSLGVASFREYASTRYDPTKKIEPWHTVKKEDQTELAYWKRGTRASASDFKELRDDRLFFKWKEGFLASLHAGGLQHVIDAKYTPLNPILYEQQ